MIEAAFPPFAWKVNSRDESVVLGAKFPRLRALQWRYTLFAYLCWTWSHLQCSYFSFLVAHEQYIQALLLCTELHCKDMCASLSVASKVFV